MRTVTVCSGHWETQVEEVSCGCNDGCGGCGGDCVRTICRRCWVPETITKEVPCTTYRMVSEEVPYTYTVCKYRSEERTRTVKVCRHEQEERTRTVNVCRYRNEERSRTYRVCRMVNEERTAHRQCVPLPQRRA